MGCITDSLATFEGCSADPFICLCPCRSVVSLQPSNWSGGISSVGVFDTGADALGVAWDSSVDPASSLGKGSNAPGGFGLFLALTASALGADGGFADIGSGDRVEVEG